jgi:hypothetical protein
MQCPPRPGPGLKLMKPKGFVAAASTTALGAGNVQVKGGSLRTDIVGVRVKGSYTQAGAALDVLVDDSGDASLAVAKSVRLETGSVLRLRLDPQRPPAADRPIPVVAAKRIEGVFDAVGIDLDGYSATTEYSKKGIAVRISRDA